MAKKAANKLTDAGGTRYRVSTLTHSGTGRGKDKDGPGTDTTVYIWVYGPQGSFERELNNAGRDDRKPGQRDEYFFEGPLVHPIQRIAFRMPGPANGPNWKWHCRTVVVTNLDNSYSSIVNDFGWVDRLEQLVPEEGKPVDLPRPVDLPKP